MRHKDKLRNLVTAAILAAAVTVLTMGPIHIPIPLTGGYIHVGDAVIYLAACLLPLPYAMAAGAVGAGLADLLTAPMWVLPTLMVKAVICLPFTGRKERVLCTRNVLAAGVACVVSPTLYGLAGGIMAGGWAAFWPQFTGTFIQGVGSGIIFLVLAWGVDRTGLRARVAA